MCAVCMFSPPLREFDTGGLDFFHGLKLGVGRQPGGAMFYAYSSQREFTRFNTGEGRTKVNRQIDNTCIKLLNN